MKKKNISELLSRPVKVCARQCNQCLFSKNKIVSNKRRVQLLESCEKEDTHFICHKGTIAGINLVCRGFYENKTTRYLEMMKSIGRMEFVNPDLLEAPALKVRKSKKEVRQSSSRPRKL